MCDESKSVKVYQDLQSGSVKKSTSLDSSSDVKEVDENIKPNVQDTVLVGNLITTTKVVSNPVVERNTAVGKCETTNILVNKSGTTLTENGKEICNNTIKEIKMYNKMRSAIPEESANYSMNTVTQNGEDFLFQKGKENCQKAADKAVMGSESPIALADNAMKSIIQKRDEILSDYFEKLKLIYEDSDSANVPADNYVHVTEKDKDNTINVPKSLRMGPESNNLVDDNSVEFVIRKCEEVSDKTIEKQTIDYKTESESDLQLSIVSTDNSKDIIIQKDKVNCEEAAEIPVMCSNTKSELSIALADSTLRSLIQKRDEILSDYYEKLKLIYEHSESFNIPADNSLHVTRKCREIFINIPKSLRMNHKLGPQSTNLLADNSVDLLTQNCAEVSDKTIENQIFGYENESESSLQLFNAPAVKSVNVIQKDKENCEQSANRAVIRYETEPVSPIAFGDYSVNTLTQKSIEILKKSFEKLIMNSEILESYILTKKGKKIYINVPKPLRLGHKTELELTNSLADNSIEFLIQKCVEIFNKAAVKTRKANELEWPYTSAEYSVKTVTQKPEEILSKYFEKLTNFDKEGESYNGSTDKKLCNNAFKSLRMDHKTESEPSNVLADNVVDLLIKKCEEIFNKAAKKTEIRYEIEPPISADYLVKTVTQKREEVSEKNLEKQIFGYESVSESILKLSNAFIDNSNYEKTSDELVMDYKTESESSIGFADYAVDNNSQDFLTQNGNGIFKKTAEKSIMCIETELESSRAFVDNSTFEDIIVQKVEENCNDSVENLITQKDEEIYKNSIHKLKTGCEAKSESYNSSYDKLSSVNSVNLKGEEICKMAVEKLSKDRNIELPKVTAYKSVHSVTTKTEAIYKKTFEKLIPVEKIKLLCANMIETQYQNSEEIIEQSLAENDKLSKSQNASMNYYVESLAKKAKETRLLGRQQKKKGKKIEPSIKYLVDYPFNVVGKKLQPLSHSKNSLSLPSLEFPPPCQIIDEKLLAPLLSNEKLNELKEKNNNMPAVKTFDTNVPILCKSPKLVLYSLKEMQKDEFSRRSWYNNNSISTIANEYQSEITVKFPMEISNLIYIDNISLQAKVIADEAWEKIISADKNKHIKF